jgi:hypothetical protein
LPRVLRTPRKNNITLDRHKQVAVQKGKLGSSAAADEPSLFQFGTVTVSSHFFLRRAKVNSSFAEVQPREVRHMSNSIQSTQALNAQAQTQQSAQAPKTPQATTQTAAPHDKVTISETAKQALAGNTKSAAKGGIDHDGDKH